MNTYYRIGYLVSRTSDGSEKNFRYPPQWDNFQTIHEGLEYARSRFDNHKKEFEVTKFTSEIITNTDRP